LQYVTSPVHHYRQDAVKRQLPVLNLLKDQKSGFSPDSLHQFTSNLAWPAGTWVRLAVQNFISNGAGVAGGNAAPNIKMSTFW